MDESAARGSERTPLRERTTLGLNPTSEKHYPKQTNDRGNAS